jgi:hypothetical protein
VETRRVDEIVWRKDLYPRFEPNPTIIDQYAEALDQLPPIEINQRNELIDGYHRWTAHKAAKAETLPVTVTVTDSDKQFLRLAIERNAKHGLQLSAAEKKHYALEMYDGKPDEKAALARLFSVSERTIASWTSRRDKDLKARRNQQIAEMWLACYTDEEIAEGLGCSVQPVKEQTEKPDENETLQKNLVFSAYQDTDWTPPLYNVWKRQDKTNSTAHFGNSEASFTDNLLYLYTEPFDIVVDPFGGGGATVDVCKKRLRRYWVSDRLPSVKRTDIRQWDILDGPPPLHKRWNDVRLLFLDPPYWKQAEGQYSGDAQDLANMPLDQFYATLTKLVMDCAGKMQPGSHVALMIQPTQWKNEDKHITDHVVDLCQRVGAPLALRMRVSCPYESQQSTAQQVDWAKSNRQVLVQTREIIVWEVV